MATEYIVKEQPAKPSEQGVVLTPNSAVIKLGNLEPIDEPLSSTFKLDRSQYKILELEDDDVVFYGDHSFFNGVLQSFRLHKSITLSPDVIWLLIVQGFSYHVAANAEKLRPLFVSFNGKQELTVLRLDKNPETATKDDWKGIVDEFVNEIDEKTKDGIARTLEPKFSTTTPCSHTAGMISIMSAMQHYFDYRVIMGGCGFPSITIEGTVADWESVKEKTQALSKYELEWWTSRLIPILDQFINARKGTPDYSFWLKMVRENNGRNPYDPSFIDGWLCTFFPYNKFGDRMNLTRIYESFGSYKLPSEILDTPFILQIVDPALLEAAEPGITAKVNSHKEAILELIDKMPSVKINSQFDAGFFGMKETREGPGVYSVKPIIGWGILLDVPPKKGPSKLPRRW